MKPLTVLAKIRSGEEQALRAVLDQIQGDFANNPYVRFPQSELTHFARWVIIDDEENGPRLLFATIYDGRLRAYLKEVADISPNAAAVWGKCEGFQSGQNLVRYLRKCRIRNRGYYIAFRKENLASIRNKIAIRQTMEKMLGSRGLSGDFDNADVSELRRRMSRLRPRFRWLRAIGCWLRRFLAGAGEFLHDLWFKPFLNLAYWYADNAVIPIRQDINRVTTRCLEDRPRPTAVRDEPATEPSCFTVYVKVKPGYRLWLEPAMFGSRTLGLFGWPPGNFANVFTLHEFRWIILDKGTRLIFMSTFDGTWENYMADFIDKLVWALNAIYKFTEDYPPGGMRETVAFKRWIRDHQPIASVIYNAYPQETVLNYMRDLEIADLLAVKDDREFAEALLASL